MITTLRVAAIQMASENGAVRENLERAGRLVAEAANAGARLIVLPELFAAGYWLTEKAWEAAEPQGGMTEAWLREIAKQWKVYVGGSYLLARGEDFLNVFALANPAGEIAGRVPKRKPASFEAYLFAGEESTHLIDTDIGKVGVGICYDNAFRFLADAMIAGDADILLMPLSAPTPQRSWYFPRGRAEAYRASLQEGPRNLARILGIPTVLANKCGAWSTDLPVPLMSQTSQFDGMSSIVDAGGVPLAELADEERALVADVSLDRARKQKSLPVEALRHGRWIRKVPRELRMSWPFELLGRGSYARNTRRRAKAKAISLTH